MKILDEFREFEEYITALMKMKKKPIKEIYEQVQYCTQVVPRSYLLCCVGGIYISSQEAPAKDILKDLIEAIKGVQHPMRGLFLRNYLTVISKNRLPDTGSVLEGVGGNCSDAISFLLQNFVETNRLWVRLQTQGASKDKKKREKERMDLRILVGTNLVRLSQLEGLGLSEYQTTVLPKVLEEVISCKDTIAQSYLMDCFIQVFPDEFHLHTLEPFLQACSQLKEKVNVRIILEALMERLSHFSPSGAETNGVNSFKLFSDCISALIEARPNMTLPETLKLHTALTNFALKCHPKRIDFVSQCLTASGSLIEKSPFSSSPPESEASQETTAQIEALLSSPLSSLSLKVLDITAYGKLMSYLPWSNWKEVASTLIKAVIANNTPLCEVGQVEQLFGIITPLLKDSSPDSSITSPAGGKAAGPTQKFKEEQYLVAKLPKLMRNDDSDVLIQVLQVAKVKFSQGGSSRIQFTFPALVFNALSLARAVFQKEKSSEYQGAYSSKKVFQFVIELITQLSTSHPEIAMKLFLQAAHASDDCGFPVISYEFVKEALLLYENDITGKEIIVTSF